MPYIKVSKEAEWGYQLLLGAHCHRFSIATAGSVEAIISSWNLIEFGSGWDLVRISINQQWLTTHDDEQ